MFRRKNPDIGRSDSETVGRKRRRWVKPLIIGLILAVALYYLIGMIWVTEIDDNVEFSPAQPTINGSRAVDMAAALIEREVDENGWTANDPFFLPGSLLDNMPNYQQGIIYALSRFAIDLSEQLGRSRGTSPVDSDLERATGLLKYPGTIWLFDLSSSLAPTASAESQYRAARRALLAYNQRLAEGQATFERRADNLMSVLERIANDLGSMSAIIDAHLQEESGWLLDFQVDDIFYQTKGRLYAYCMILQALGVDFEPVIAERNLTQVWNQMLESAREAAEQHPLVVFNGSPSSQFIPSHLANQGFLLLRMRTQLREVSNVLLK